MPITTCRGQLMRRAVKRDGFTKKKRALFLDMLAATCNIGLAAAAAGVDKGTPTRARRRDPAFAALWAQAIEQGTERLREQLVAHSMGQVDLGENPDGERQEPAAVAFDPRLAMETLKTIAALDTGGRGRAGGARARPAYASDAEVDLLLMQRVEALAAKLDRA